MTVKDLARAWASIDGHIDDFDNGAKAGSIEAFGGHYAGYVVEAEEQLRRAIGYAMARKA